MNDNQNKQTNGQKKLCVPLPNRKRAVRKKKSSVANKHSGTHKEAINLKA